MAELLNCPFCGNDVNDDEGCYPVDRSGRMWEVRCGNPDCFAHDPVRATRQDTIAAWNRRTSPPQAAGGEPVAWMYDYTDEHGVPQRDFTTGPFLASWVSAKKAKATPLYDHPPAVGQECLQALRSYEQADHDGVMVLVSRQALDMAISALSGAQPAGGGAE